METRQPENFPSIGEVHRRNEFGSISATNGVISLNFGSYSKTPENVDKLFTGYIEDDKKTWIIYLGRDGKPALYYPDRNKDGSVIGEGINVKYYGDRDRIIEAVKHG